jgi:Tfp pilus assembly protein PilF
MAGRTDERISAARRAISGGMLDPARAIADEVLASEPNHLDALEIRALVEMEKGEHAAAERTLRTAIAVAPKRRWPYGDLARLLLKNNRIVDAEAVAREALSADRSNPDAHAMLGSLLAGREQWAEAATYFRQAMELAGPHPQLHAGLGHALLRLGRLEEARVLLEAATGADPKALEPAVHLAEVEERLGQFEKAAAHLDHAERLARAAGTDVDLQRSVLLTRMGRTEDALALLDHRGDLSGAALLQRGRLRERTGRYAEAWSDWTSGKAQLARDRNHRYHADNVAAQAAALVSFVNQSRSIARASLRTGTPQPIFIVGFPRSGTTLTEQILASHSEIAAGGELPFGSELRELAGKLAGGDADFPQGLKGDWPTALRDHYLGRAEGLGLLDGGKSWFTDKMPTNDMWLPLLRAAFPQSPVILVRRDPLDVLTSVMAHDMTHGFHCAYAIEDAARHLALVDRLIEHYSGAEVGPTYELRYESLVAHQAGETERLMAGIGLPMEPAQLTFHERGAVAATPSYAQVAEPINDRSIGRSRNFATELEAVRPIVAEAMARGGYAD